MVLTELADTSVGGVRRVVAELGVLATRLLQLLTQVDVLTLATVPAPRTVTVEAPVLTVAHAVVETRTEDTRLVQLARLTVVTVSAGARELGVAVVRACALVLTRRAEAWVVVLTLSTVMPIETRAVVQALRDVDASATVLTWCDGTRIKLMTLVAIVTMSTPAFMLRL